MEQADYCTVVGRVIVEAHNMPGIKADFVNPLMSQHICCICALALRSPVQTGCGHRFCYDCLIMSNGGLIHCPIDSQKITQVYKQSKLNYFDI